VSVLDLDRPTIDELFLEFYTHSFNLMLSLTSFLIVVSCVYMGNIYGTHEQDTHNLQSSSFQLIHYSILIYWSSCYETPFPYTATSSSFRINSYKDSILRTDGSLHLSSWSRYSNFSAMVD
jgi:hypothetical protein